MKQLQEEILTLKEKENAILLVHNYQRPEVQEIADYLGDSLALCKRAQKEKNADIIVFCGVNFMAESAAILNPDKTVLLPDPSSRCPLADQCPKNAVIEAKRQYPGVPAVLYVNTLADAKAEADIMCTSSNADKIVQSLGTDQVIFGPDWNLGWHVTRQLNSGIELIPIPKHGYCYVHKMFDLPTLQSLKAKYPNAELVVHPECDPEVQKIADLVGSTQQMFEWGKNTSADVIIVGTEIGLVERMRREIPGKTFIPALNDAICRDMKKITLEKIRDVLVNKNYVCTVPDEIAERASNGIKKMVQLS
jgi:quinolinate synthase